MLICFFNIRSIIHFEFVPEENAVNGTFYMEVLISLIDAMTRKRDCSLIFHCDNMPAHSSLWVSWLLAGKEISTMDHPPVVSWLGSSWLLAVSKTQECAEIIAFIRHWGH
jgi:hypothetical protein